MDRSGLLRSLIKSRPTATGVEILEDFLDVVFETVADEIISENVFQEAYAEGLEFLLGAGYHMPVR